MADVVDWATEDVVHWLTQQGYSHEITDIVTKSDIDGPKLLSQGNTSLLSLGVNRLGERKKILRDVKNLLAMHTYGCIEKSEYPAGSALSLSLSLACTRLRPNEVKKVTPCTLLSFS